MLSYYFMTLLCNCLARKRNLRFMILTPLLIFLNEKPASQRSDAGLQIYETQYNHEIQSDNCAQALQPNVSDIVTSFWHPCRWRSVRNDFRSGDPVHSNGIWLRVSQLIRCYFQVAQAVSSFKFNKNTTHSTANHDGSILLSLMKRDVECVNSEGTCPSG